MISHYIPADSVERIRVGVRSIGDLTESQVLFGFSTEDTPDTWHAAQWDGDAVTIKDSTYGDVQKAVASILVGGSVGVSIPEGHVHTWIRLVTPPEDVIRKVGMIKHW